jgi:hypothetical protein
MMPLTRNFSAAMPFGNAGGSPPDVTYSGPLLSGPINKVPLENVAAVALKYVNPP